MKKTLLISVLFILPIVSFAAISVQKTNSVGILKTSSNVYIAGATANIPQENQGDVYAVAGTIFATGNVNQDLVAAGGTVIISSPRISGDLRLAGGTINLSSQVYGDLLVAGGQIEISPSSAIYGDFIIAGGTINVGGSINSGNSGGKIFGDAVNISGTVSRDIDVEAKHLTIESTAVINGNINYKGSEEAIIKDGAKVNGQISFTKIEAKKVMKAGAAAIFTVVWLIKLLTMLVAALVLFFLMKKNIAKVAAEAVDTCWKKLLKGFIALIVVPVAVIVLLITIVGSIIGVFGIALYILLLVLAAAFSGIFVAELLNRWIFRGKKPLNWQMVILGVIVMEFLAFIPFFGWIVNFVIFLVALGTVYGMICCRKDGACCCKSE